MVVKRGHEATLVRCAGKPVASVATEHVLRVVDTTAAGDSFAGAYLAARLGGAAAVGAAAAGNRLAARVGAAPGRRAARNVYGRPRSLTLVLTAPGSKPRPADEHPRQPQPQPNQPLYRNGRTNG